MLDRITIFQEKNKEVSEQLNVLVQELLALSTIASESNQQIALQAEEMMISTDENAEKIHHISENIASISEQIEVLGTMNEDIAISAKEIDTLSQSNQKIIDLASNSMEGIAVSASKSKEIVQKLLEESNEILGIIGVITGISNQTTILALNATIEAARAGESGRGFAVVASEIQKLSEQTKGAVLNIGSIIHEVVNNTELTVSTIDDSVLLTREGVAHMKEAEKSTIKITEANESMVARINQMKQISEEVTSNEKKVVATMSGVSKNTMQNVRSVEQVTNSTKESSQVAIQLVEMVEQIRTLAERLNRD